MSQIHQCQSCGEWRHVSYFSKDRICDHCIRAGKVYRPVTLSKDEIAQATHMRRAAKAIIAGWVDTGIMPEEITDTERKIIRRRALDLVSNEVIAREMGISPKRAESLEARAQAKLLRLALDQAPLWLMSGNDPAA